MLRCSLVSVHMDSTGHHPKHVYYSDRNLVLESLLDINLVQKDLLKMKFVFTGDLQYPG